MSNAGIHTELLHFLEQRSSYTHTPDEVRHIQTHISHVFIVTPYVYKLKKPVEFGFLDYSSLDKRQKFCQKELQLNRRLTEDVYLDVVVITERDGSYAFESSDEVRNSDPVVEYAVKMRKLEDIYFLHTYIENDTLTERHLERVADKLARFYSRQHPDKEIARWGSIENVRVNTDENFEQTKSFVGETIDPRSYDASKCIPMSILGGTKHCFKTSRDRMHRRWTWRPAPGAYLHNARQGDDLRLYRV